MTRQTCFLVCNAHLDPVWLWPWEEGLAEAISTFRVAADFCDQYPDFVFNHNESLLYEWVERNDPELFARIRGHVRTGRWHIAGGAYLQPDLIAPAGESLLRHFLLGKNYFQDKFGVEPTTAYNFDSFGHPQGLIQVLAGCGFDSYVFCRPNRGALALPVGSFRWQHASGCEIVARRSDDHYISQGEILQKVRDGKWPEFYREEGDFLLLWGLGNHGGGPSHDEYAQLRRLPEVCPEVDFVESTPEAFFRHSLARRPRAGLPTFSGDLKPFSEGCYTSMQRVKTAHHRVENLLSLTEALAAQAWWQGRREYPAADLHVAWKDLLFSEFHDVLPGSAIPSVEADSLNLLGHAEEILRRKKVECQIALLRDEPLAERSRAPIFVFNPHSWETTMEVEIEYCTDRQHPTDAIVRSLSAQGRPVAAQFEKAEHNLDGEPWAEWRQKAVFMATVPPCSYRRIDADYSVLPPEKVQRWQPPPLPAGPEWRLCTPHLEVAFDLRRGLLAELRCQGQTVLAAGSFEPLVFSDLPHSWETLPEWREPLGRFRLATPQEAARIMNSAQVNPDFAAGKPPVHLLEDGPIRSVLEAIFVHEGSYLVQRYTVLKTRPVLHLDQTIFWNEHDRMLKLGLASAPGLTRLQAEKCYSIDDETANAAAGSELDCQRFLRLSGTAPACGILAYGSHGYSRLGNQLRLSVLRSPAYGCMRVAPAWRRFQDRYMPRHDQGLRQARFSFVFGELAASQDALARTAAEYNVPLSPLVYFPTRKDQPPRTPESFLHLSAANVLLTALKREERGDGLILRCWETAGRNTPFTLTVAGRDFALTIGAHALATFRLGRDGSLTPTDLLERPLETHA